MNTFFYFYNFIIPIIIAISWYYTTLPGSIIYPNKDYKKPTLYDAVISWLTLYLPLSIVLYYYYSTLVLNKENTCNYLSTLSNMVCGK